MDLLDFLEKLPQRAAEKKSENKRFLAKLRKRPPRDLDRLMQGLHAEAFNEINCLECANCCKTTGPLFTQADIGRIAGQLRLKPGEFVERYLRLDEDGDYVLQQVPCPFLEADNSCRIYEIRPKACREYPHTDRKKFHQIAGLTLKNTAICPAAFRIVEEMKRHLPEYR